VRRFVWIFGSLALLASLSSTARAYEDQATVGLAVGYAGMPGADSGPKNGVNVALSVGGGLGDAWSIQGFLAYDVFLGDRAIHVGMAGLETVYALDIVRFVPLIGFGLDGLLSVRERQAFGDFALHALLGFDFLINPRWIIGADARVLWIPTYQKSALDQFMITAALRAGVRFDVHRR
jgi:hypothetical protein